MSLKTMALKDLNPHLLCVLCGGYLVDATTITECLHSFCRSCIVKYLQTSFHCPVCDVEVHKTKPLLHIRRDRTLQEIVYKIVPGMYCEELNRRRAFESRLIEAENALSSTETKVTATNDVDPDDKGKGSPLFEDPVCITLEYFRKTRNRLEKEVFPTRYLRCSSAVTVGVLTKFLAMKFGIPDSHTTEIIRSDEILDGHLTMTEVSRMYGLYTKPFVDLQYVFLEKDDTSVPVSKKTNNLEHTKKKRSKKRKGSKNQLKRGLALSAPHPPKYTLTEKNFVLSNSSENSREFPRDSCLSQPCDSERKEETLTSSPHSRESVIKQELEISLSFLNDSSSKLSRNGDVDCSFPLKNDNTGETGKECPDTAEKCNTNDHNLSRLKINAAENLTQQMKTELEELSTAATVVDQGTEFGGSKALSPSGSVENLTSELFMNNSLSHMQNLFT